jgi:hypothetical protein
VGHLGDEPDALDSLGKFGGASGRVDSGGHGNDEPNEPGRPPAMTQNGRGLQEGPRTGRGSAAAARGRGREGGQARAGPTGSRRRLHRSASVRGGAAQAGGAEEGGAARREGEGRD